MATAYILRPAIVGQATAPFIGARKLQVQLRVSVSEGDDDNLTSLEVKINGFGMRKGLYGRVRQAMLARRSTIASAFPFTPALCLSMIFLAYLYATRSCSFSKGANSQSAESLVFAFE